MNQTINMFLSFSIHFELSNYRRMPTAVNNMMDTGFSTPAYQFNTNKIKETTEPIQEAIYDFGGANVKSCASIALNKSISKGLIPPGTKLPQQQWATASNIQQQNPITSPSTIIRNPVVQMHGPHIELCHFETNSPISSHAYARLPLRAHAICTLDRFN